MHAQVAAKYQDNMSQRVFLVGDAAHRFPPAGGFGMNCGLQDAHNLAWKLSYVVQGIADTKLPGTTYEKGEFNILCDTSPLFLR